MLTVITFACVDSSCKAFLTTLVRLVGLYDLHSYIVCACSADFIGLVGAPKLNKLQREYIITYCSLSFFCTNGISNSVISLRSLSSVLFGLFL